jgi:CRP/FNR family cyclic AMP-dependent transcriptional regulator
MLQTIPLFSFLSEEKVAALQAATRHQIFPAQSVIVHTGDYSDGLYVVVSGRVVLAVEDEDGGDYIVSTLEQNDIFGETAFSHEARCSFTVRSEQRCELLFVPKVQLLECLEHNPKAMTCLLGIVLTRMQTLYKKIDSLALKTVQDRVARFLLEEQHNVNGRPVVPWKATQIAARVGASREMVSRVLKWMAQRGLIERHKGGLIVLDNAALSNHRNNRRSGQHSQGAVAASKQPTQSVPRRGETVIQ